MWCFPAVGLTAVMLKPDLLNAHERMVSMRKFAALLVAVALSLAVAQSAATPDQRHVRAQLRGGVSLVGGGVTRVGGGVSVRVPPGWHLLHGWLSDVAYPVPRLALASFPAKLSRHTCECGTPNVIHFPRKGAFLFVWEYPRYPRSALKRIPPHETRYRVGQGNPHWFECAGPNWLTAFRESDSVFNVEVYLGPAAGPGVRAEMDAVLNSFRLARPR